MRAIHTVGSVGEWSGGPARSVTSLCSAIAIAGCHVDLVVGHNPKRDAQLIVPASSGVRLHLVRAHWIGRFQFLPGFGRLVERLAMDTLPVDSSLLVHDHGLWNLANMASAQAARRIGVPYVLHPRGMMERWALEHKQGKKRLAWILYQKRIAASSAALVAASKQEHDSIKQLLPRSPVAVIPNGIQVPSEVPDRAARTEGRIGRVLFMSRVHPVKNLSGLVQAWQQVCRSPSRQNWVLTIAGPDELDHTREIKAMVRTLGLDSRVEFIGPVPESGKEAVLNEADLFVLPSHSENFGVAVAEALAHGLPVVATRGTPWSDLVAHRCGWWVDAGPDALGQALGEAIDLTAAERHVMGLRGREFAGRVFGWERIASAIILLYEWVLGHTRAVPSFVSV